jgi:hypothetical protein
MIQVAIAIVDVTVTVLIGIRDFIRGFRDAL